MRENLDTAHKRTRYLYNLRQRDAQFNVGLVLGRNYTLSRRLESVRLDLPQSSVVHFEFGKSVPWLAIS